MYHHRGLQTWGALSRLLLDLLQKADRASSLCPFQVPVETARMAMAHPQDCDFQQ